MVSSSVFFRVSTVSVAALVGLVAAGCDLIPGAAFPCNDDSNCSSAQSCVSGYCTAVDPEDAGRVVVGDGGDPEPTPEPGEPEPEADGGEPDGDVDGGGLDAGEPESAPDAGGSDAGNADAGNADAGNADAGNADAGARVDGGEPLDAGEPEPVLPPDSVSTFNLPEILAFPLNVDVTIAGDICEGNEIFFDTDTEEWGRDAQSIAANCNNALQALNGMTTVATSNGISVLMAQSWTVASGARVRLKGSRRAAFFAPGTITVDGVIDASGRFKQDQTIVDGPGGLSGNEACLGRDGEVDGREGGGGGGGGGATVGAAGGAGKNGSPGGTGGAIVTSTDGLVVGCRGGRGADATQDGGEGGAAGGAVHLVSLSTLTGQGEVRANGGRGLIGVRLEKAAGGGGGSGGTIWLQAPVVSFAGLLIANGGGGAGGGGEGNDETGTAGVRPALGRSSIGGSCGDSYTGNSTSSECGSGGPGGWRVPPLPGYSTTASGNVAGGGGGGAAGRIFISTFSSCAGVAPRTSPAVSVSPVVGTTTPTACPLSPAVCGDGIVTLPEVCDDGANLQEVIGCGCNATCTEVSSCGEDRSVAGGSLNLSDLFVARSFVSVSEQGALSGTANGLESVIVDCAGESTCPLTCNSGTDCINICRSGSDCSLDCNSVGGVCAMYCEEGATCDVINCTSTGGDPEFCGLYPWTSATSQ